MIVYNAGQTYCKQTFWRWLPYLDTAVRTDIIFKRRRSADTVTSHLGDKPTGRQPTGRNILVNWATEVLKCERLTIAVLEQLCAVLGQRQFYITHQTNISHSSLECYEVAGLIAPSKCSVNQTAQVVSQPISNFLPTISGYFNNDPLPKTISNQ